MLERFYPDEYWDSAYSIDFEEMRDKGYRGVLFDIDNTLVPHDAPADERAIGLFARLRELGMAVCLKRYLEKVVLYFYEKQRNSEK